MKLTAIDEAFGAGSGGYNQQRAKQIMLDELSKVDLRIDVLIVEFKKNA